MDLIPQAIAATASAPDGPFTTSNIIPTVWMVAVSMLGGAASFYRKMKSGEVRYFNIMELIGELLVSALVGLITFWICRSYNVDGYLTGVACAITGHMGTRAIAIFEKILTTKLGLKADEQPGGKE